MRWTTRREHETQYIAAPDPESGECRTRALELALRDRAVSIAELLPHVDAFTAAMRREGRSPEKMVVVLKTLVARTRGTRPPDGTDSRGQARDAASLMDQLVSRAISRFFRDD